MDVVCMVNDGWHFERMRASLGVDPAGAPHSVRALHPADMGLAAAAVLNVGIAATGGEWVVIVHQDVRCPPGWLSRVEVSLGALPSDAAVVGITGVDRRSRFLGHIVDPNGHCRWTSGSRPAFTLDEVALFIRRDSGLRFDEDCPGFHCYGADICLEASRRGLGVWTIDAPLLHLSTGRRDAAYAAASTWLLSKWRHAHRLPIATPATLLGEGRWLGPLRLPGLARLRRRRSAVAGRGACSDGECRVGFEELMQAELAAATTRGLLGRLKGESAAG